MSGPARAGFVLLYCALVAASVFFSTRKLEALGYHTRDFAYYAQFHARLGDGRLAQRYSINPWGQSFLGYRGREGERGFHRAIHFEPIKYAQAGVYALAGGLTGVFLFNAALFYLPVLYLVFAAPSRGAADGAFYGLAAGLYALQPAALQAVSFDLRPYLFLLPFVSLAFLAVHLRRPRLETILLFNLVFLAREEALVFTLVLLLYAWARNGTDETERPPRLLPALAASYAVWLLAILAFYRWSGYGNPQGVERTLLLMAGFAVAGVAGVHFGRRWLPRDLLAPLVLASVLLPLYWPGNPRFPFDPRYNLHAGWLLWIVVAAWPRARAGRAGTAVLVGLASAVALAVVTDFAPPRRGSFQVNKDSAFTAYRHYTARVGDTAIVRTARDRLAAERARVLTDKSTHQAFYALEDVYVFERLPRDMAPPPAKDPDAHEAVLRRLLRDEVDAIVVSTETLEALRPRLAAAGIVGRARPVAANESFAVLEVER